VKPATQAVLAVALVGGALWWFVRRATPPAVPPPTDETDLDGIADFLGVSQVCVDLAKAMPTAGGICASLEGALGVFKKVATLFQGCEGTPPTAAELVQWEAKNRALNGACRGFTDEFAWLRCPNTRAAKLKQVSPSDPGAKTRAGICISYVNGCAPLTFASANVRCKAGTKIYGTGRSAVRGTGRVDGSTNMQERAYSECLKRFGGARPSATALRRCEREKPLNAELLPVSLSKFPAPWSAWFSNARDHRT
jgi:hypothetical protein